MRVEDLDAVDIVCVAAISIAGISRPKLFVRKTPKCSRLGLTPKEPIAPIISDAPPSVPPNRFCDFGSSRDLEYPNC